MRLRCRKCRKINDFNRKNNAENTSLAWASKCAWCGADINKQFLSFAEMRRSEQMLKMKEERE